jgi:hypothetical protein
MIIKLLYFVTGPVNMEFSAGLLDNWHLEVFNNSDGVVPMTLKVFDIDSGVHMIGNTSRTVYPHTHEYLSLTTNGVHHTLAQIEYPEGTGPVLLTLYGRNKNSIALPGAIYIKQTLTELVNGIDA